ncbi:MAG: aldehyde dehydrogenase family protein [Deltaproteobacteria bacterium]|nr:aldehyde dehydrogenase family protein [Deltaproteobacteria bacterium]
MAAVLEVRSPYDGAVVASLPLDGPEAVQRKIAAASAAFGRWRDVPLEDRCRLVAKGLEWFRRDGERIAREISSQMGKPVTQARREIETMLDRARWAIGAVEDALATELVPPAGDLHRRIEHVPRGVVLDIAAWNYPLLVPVNVVVPALLAGNTVVLKHSERTPLTGEVFARAFGTLDVPDVLVHVVVSRAGASRLIDDPRIAHVSFTGSVATGRAVYRRAAERMVPCGLELGGKDAAYVAADADLAFAVENVVDGACYNAGQSCCAVERVYVHRSVYDEFVDRALEALGGYRMGDPLEESTTLGPLAIRDAIGPLEARIEEAKRRGASVLFGGGRAPVVGGGFFAPTLVVDVPNDSSLMQEESFAPIVPVRMVEDDEQALGLMRDTRFGLTASVWTRDEERAERMARDLEVGTVFQNRCDYVDPALPWSGARESGLGATLSRHGFLHLTRPRALHFRGGPVR